MMNSPGFDNIAYEGAAKVTTQTTDNMYYEVPVQSSTNTTGGAKQVRGLKSHNKLVIFMIVMVVVLVLFGIAACIGFAVEIAKLKTEVVREIRGSSPQNFNSKLLGACQRNISAPTYSELKERIKFLENVAMLGHFPDFPVSSCTALSSSSPSGYYWVRASNGSAVRVYCDMTRSCGGVTGGWMRVAHLDMTDCGQHCPSGLALQIDENLRTCVINITNSGACSLVTLPSSVLRYSRVCGRIKAYQVGSTDAFADNGRGTSLSIDDNYVDGVSLTHGRNPRQHIWTFAAAHNCGNCRPVPTFVTPDYFCDTGSVNGFQNGFFYRDNPVWDGAGCGPMNACCSFNTPPWFYKQLPQPTTDDIEMRVCRDQPSGDEDIAIERVDIFVK